jgi:hypothetical protein
MELRKLELELEIGIGIGIGFNGIESNQLNPIN